MKSLFDLMNAERKPIALFGGMCTTVNEPVVGFFNSKSGIISFIFKMPNLKKFVPFLLKNT